jgi:hypothetical protein
LAAPKGNKFAKGGKRAGAGRKPLKTKELCAVAFTERIPLLCQIADDDEEKTVDRLAALAQLAKVGVPAQAELEAKCVVNWNLPSAWPDAPIRSVGVDQPDPSAK